jgi:hypothetical protein
MSTTSSLNSSAALQILQQASVPTPSKKDEEPSAGSVILATANGVAIPSVGGAQSQAKAKISDAFMDRPIDIQQLKFNLMRRLGEELGVKMDDFEDPRDYGSAIREVIGKIKASPTGAMYLAKLEKDLGLDKLGISIDDLVDAISSPDGEGGKKLDAALRAETGEEARKAAEDMETIMRGLKTDDAGLYGP